MEVIYWLLKALIAIVFIVIGIPCILAVSFGVIAFAAILILEYLDSKK